MVNSIICDNNVCIIFTSVGRHHGLFHVGVATLLRSVPELRVLSFRHLLVGRTTSFPHGDSQFLFLGNLHTKSMALIRLSRKIMFVDDRYSPRLISWNFQHSEVIGWNFFSCIFFYFLNKFLPHCDLLEQCKCWRTLLGSTSAFSSKL